LNEIHELRTIRLTLIRLMFCCAKDMIKIGEQTMTIYGYARVSTDGQTLAAQEAALHEAGAAKVYAEKVSGVVTERAALAKALRMLGEGDVLLHGYCPNLRRQPHDHQSASGWVASQFLRLWQCSVTLTALPITPPGGARPLGPRSMSPFLLSAQPLQFVKMTLDKANYFAAVKLVWGWNASGAPGRLQNPFVASYFAVKIH
jgi:hypothetical protein